MCTSASLHWLVACVRYKSKPSCTPDTMRAIMRSASDAHTIASTNLPDEANGMLTHEEALAVHGLPATLQARSMAGHALSNLDPGFAAYPLVHRDELIDVLSPYSGTLLTANRHTIGIYAYPDKTYAVFDPLPASVQKACAQNLISILSQAVGPLDEFECTKLTLAPSVPSEILPRKAGWRRPLLPRTQLPQPAETRA